MLLGEKISSLRKTKGISQELLAENSRISLRTIQRIEAGSSLPRPYTVRMIADALGVPVEQLSSGQSDVKEESDLASLALMNLCGVAAIFPFMNIILPLVVWLKHKSIPQINAVGRKIISFQILWTLGLITLLILTRILQIGTTGSVAIGRFPPTIVIVYLVLLGVNFFFVIREASRLKKGDCNIYSFVPALL